MEQLPADYVHVYVGRGHHNHRLPVGQWACPITGSPGRCLAGTAFLLPGARLLGRSGTTDIAGEKFAANAVAMSALRIPAPPLCEHGSLPTLWGRACPAGTSS